MRNILLKKIAFLLIFSSLICSCTQHELDYSSFNEFRLETISSFYDLEEDKYGIYLYREDCPSCQNIKEDLLNYMNNLINNDNLLKLYLYNTNRLGGELVSYNPGDGLSVEETKEYLINNDIYTLEETIINYVPSLYVISQKKLTDYYAGAEIIDYLNSY